MLFEFITETISFTTCLFILFGAIILSIKTRFIQFRAIPKMIKIIFERKKNKSCDNTISMKKALLTAMSSSIGIGNIVSPVIAIKLGGPGALIGFILATIFGSAATYTEVTFALKNRSRNKDGSINGGAMPYIKKALSEKWAKIYAGSALLVLTVWASNQANALADLLQAHSVPKYLTGILLAVSVSYILLGGVKRVGEISAKLVPTMLVLYLSAISWIIFNNIENIGLAMSLIFKSAFTPKAIFGAGTGYGIHTALRWGLAKGYFSNISGLGMSTIPHSMSATNNPINQGIISMAAVYMNGIICFLTGLAVLLTQGWLDASSGIGINVIAKIFTNYFSSIGMIAIAFSAFLFSFGTIVGEGFMGSHCFTYNFKQKYLKYYNLVMALLIFLGSISDVKFLAQITDIFLLPLALPNIISIILLAFRNEKEINIDLNPQEKFIPATKVNVPNKDCGHIPLEIKTGKTLNADA
jgi:alanine or glycine:cation symporter, AGCS family